MRVARMLGIVALAGLLIGGLPAPTAAQWAEVCFAETGFCVQGRFLEYWQQHGGLAINGYPLSAERREVLEDGKEYTVQYFERVRMEYHPENPAPYDVLLGQFGRVVFRSVFGNARYQFEDALAPVPAQPGMAYFSETGHNVSQHFFAYWRANGGLAQFGYPLGEERVQAIADAHGSQEYLVQYFERARFEYHPEYAGTDFEVLLGQFGRAIGDRVTKVAPLFQSLYFGDPQLRESLGLPGMSQSFSTEPASDYFARPGEILYFERGAMIRILSDGREGGLIQILCGMPERGSIFLTPRPSEGFSNPWREGMPEGGGPGPQPGTYEPKYGFGLLWRGAYRDCLGYATSAEAITYTATSQRFARGYLISAPDGASAYTIDLEVLRDSAGNISGGRYQLYQLPR